MTLKQRKVAQLVGKGSSMKEVMIAAGYSPNTAVAPTKVTKSKGWQALLEEMLPDDKLLEVNRKLLDHEDWQANSSGLDKAYKIKGKYNENTTNIQINNIIPILGDMKAE